MTKYKTPMRLFGLIGYPLTHSFSKSYFNEKFVNCQIEDCRYENYSLENIEYLKDIIQSNPDLSGLNVTIPYKEKVLPFLHHISQEAKEIGAVNTLRIVRSGSAYELWGYNTDVYGFSESLKPLLKKHHQKALILGTGGASKAVKFALAKLGISYKMVSRTKSESTLTYAELSEEIIAEHSLIVNTTPLGTFPKVKEYPPLPYQYLNSQHLLYDLVYNPSVTAFLEKGIKQHCKTKNGLEMLRLQAEKAWEIWNSNE